MEMDHEDDDYEPNTEDIEDTSPYILQRRPVEDLVAVERTNLAEKRAKTDPDNELSSTRLPTNIKSISKSLDHVSRQLKGMEYDTNTSLRVVHSVLVLQKEYLMNKQKKPEFYKAGFVRNRACQLFGISTHTYGKIMKSYFSLKGISFVYTSGKGRGNFDSKVTCIPQTQSVVIAIREFVRIRRAKRQRTTAKQILEFCIREGFISVPKDTDDPEAYEKKSFDTAYRSMRRWVERNGFKRGKRTGNIVLKEHIALHRDLYLKAFLQTGHYLRKSSCKKYTLMNLTFTSTTKRTMIRFGTQMTTRTSSMVKKKIKETDTVSCVPFKDPTHAYFNRLISSVMMKRQSYLTR